MSDFKSTHDLPFEAAPWHGDPNVMLFRVGTCEGQWQPFGRSSYAIISVINSNPGNGHFEDVLEWFQYSCMRDKRHLLILAVINQNLKKHLIERRGFREFGLDNLVYEYEKMPLWLLPSNPKQSEGNPDE